MFRQLELTYFRQHESLSVTFQNGVIAIRGPNEAGKSGLIEAMTFIMGGATYLREALEDVVTWGHKPSELKAKMTFEINGVVYTSHRSKSGAEIRNEERILATGHKGVTKYFETLLGAPMDVCSKLMLANQDEIKGALSKGPSAAVELIEALSNLGVIDTIIGLVQDQLPCGATTSITSRVTTLEEQVARPIEDAGNAELLQAHNQANEVLQQATQGYASFKRTYDDMQPAAIAAQAAVDAHRQMSVKEERLKAEAIQAEVAFTEHKVPELPTNVEELRRIASDAQYMQRANDAVGLLEGLQEAYNEWEGDYDSLNKEIADQRTVLKSHERAVGECNTKIARLEAQKITQTACGLCGKDLSNVPEVVTKNSDLDQQIAVLLDERKMSADAAKEVQELLSALTAIQQVHTFNMGIFQRCSEFVVLDQGYVPPRYGWTGPEEINLDTEVQAKLQAAEAAVRNHHAAVGKKQQLESEMLRLSRAWGESTSALQASQATLFTHEKVLTQASEALQALNAAQAEVEKARQTQQAAHQALEIAEATLRERRAAHALLESQLADARKDLAEMADNNALIKFLRDARPLITDQLWGMVMSTVSSYFSDIRGTQSVVSRADNGFKVDGHNVAGLSGSTKDALGLAIRCALTQTFLPNASFLILDEASAACDEERTASMAGMVATAHFEQVLWVTHDNIVADAADQLIELGVN